jgi:hypothetical protein
MMKLFRPTEWKPASLGKEWLFSFDHPHELGDVPFDVETVLETNARFSHVTESW